MSNSRKAAGFGSRLLPDPTAAKHGCKDPCILRGPADCHGQASRQFVSGQDPVDPWMQEKDVHPWIGVNAFRESSVPQEAGDCRYDSASPGDQQPCPGCRRQLFACIPGGEDSGCQENHAGCGANGEMQWGGGHQPDSLLAISRQPMKSKQAPVSRSPTAYQDESVSIWSME